MKFPKATKFISLLWLLGPALERWISHPWRCTGRLIQTPCFRLLWRDAYTKFKTCFRGFSWSFVKLGKTTQIQQISFFYICHTKSIGRNSYLCRVFLKKVLWVKKVTFTLRSGDKDAVNIEKDTAHSRNPLLDQLEIIAEAIDYLLKGKSSFSQSELRSLAHIRQMTRMHKTKSGE